MRNDIFYWKCDSPIAIDRKKSCFSGKEYSAGDLQLARKIAADFLGHDPEVFTVLTNAGNHIVCHFAAREQEFLFRADEGKLVDDDYLIAESTVMNLLNRRGLPVPAVFQTDISMKEAPFRYQIMEFVKAPCLNAFAKKGELDEKAVAGQIGEFLAKVHGIQLPGYGFFDTRKLIADGVLVGLKATLPEYFTQCLARHLGYLADNQLLDCGEVARIERIMVKGEALLEDIPGVLLHRDCAYWNILGTPNRLLYVIDWDDAVSGDPADDLGIVNCFFEDELLEEVLKGYEKVSPVTPEFRLRIHLHTLRNMLWKAMIRSYMGYFDKGRDFFLTGGAVSLYEYTFTKIRKKLEILEQAL